MGEPVSKPTNEANDQQDMAILEEVFVRRKVQDAKWGGNRNLPAELWHVILSEEVGEVAHAILEHDMANLRDELLDVAAVAAVIIQWIDNCAGHPGLTE